MPDYAKMYIELMLAQIKVITILKETQKIIAQMYKEGITQEEEK